MTGYVIQVTNRQCPLFVRTRPTSLSGYTRAIEEAKVYRTRDGAEDWVNERGEPFAVLAVTLKEHRNGRITAAEVA